MKTRQLVLAVINECEGVLWKAIENIEKMCVQFKFGVCCDCVKHFHQIGRACM